jgi:hypothetical protein
MTDTTRELLGEAGRAIKYGATLDEWNDLEQRIQAHLASLDAEAAEGEQPTRKAKACRKCGNPVRFSEQDGWDVCDDCTFKEKPTPAAGLPELPPELPEGWNWFDRAYKTVWVSDRQHNHWSKGPVMELARHCERLYATLAEKADALTASEKARVEGEESRAAWIESARRRTEERDAAQADLEKAERLLREYWMAVPSNDWYERLNAFLSRLPQPPQQCDGSGRIPISNELPCGLKMHPLPECPHWKDCPGCHACQLERFCGGRGRLADYRHSDQFPKTVECPSTGCADPACPNRKEVGE